MPLRLPAVTLQCMSHAYLAPAACREPRAMRAPCVARWHACAHGARRRLHALPERARPVRCAPGQLNRDASVRADAPTVTHVPDHVLHVARQPLCFARRTGSAQRSPTDGVAAQKPRLQPCGIRCNTEAVQRATRNTVADPRAAEQAAAAAAVLTVALQRAWRCAPVGLVEQARAHHPRRGPSARQRSVRRATCNMQHASRNMQHAGRSMEPAASTWRIQLAARNDAACSIYFHISI